MTRDRQGEWERESTPVCTWEMIQDQDINSLLWGIMSRYWLTWAVGKEEEEEEKEGAERKMGKENNSASYGGRT